MNNERFFNHYVEILTTTLHEALGKNIVFQAQAKIAGEDIEALSNSLKELKEEIKQYGDLEQNINSKNLELSEKSIELKNALEERDIARKSASHIETFKNELIFTRNEVDRLNSERELLLQKASESESLEKELNELHAKNLEYTVEIQELKEQINYLKMTPAQRKKYDMKKLQHNEVIINEDGGSF